MLTSRPARNELLKWEKNEAGEARITVVRQDNWRIRLLSRLFYIPRERTITLDEVGTEVWLMCTGRNTVAQMIETLRTRYQLDRKEAEVSLLAYLKTLGQKRFVGFVLDGGRGEGREAKGNRRGRR